VLKENWRQIEPIAELRMLWIAVDYYEAWCRSRQRPCVPGATGIADSGPVMSLKSNDLSILLYIPSHVDHASDPAWAGTHQRIAIISNSNTQLFNHWFDRGKTILSSMPPPVFTIPMLRWI
jgi:hypothetical protein